MWFTETAWPPIILLSILSVFLFAAWYNSRRASYLIGVVLLTICSGVVYAIEQSVVTDVEKIEAAVADFCIRFQQKDLQGSLSHFSERNFADRAMVATGMLLVEIEDDVRITDLNVELSMQNSRAVSHFRANATIHVATYGNVGRRPSRWEFTWQREADEWKIVKVVRLNPLKGGKMEPLAQREN